MTPYPRARIMQPITRGPSRPTFVAGANVLGAGLAADHLAGITAGLLLIAGLAWLPARDRERGQ